MPRKEFAGKSLGFLCLFFEKMGSEEEIIFDDCLEAVLKILDDTDDRSDIYNALSIKKAACFKRLIDAERFEEQLQKNNIETLLLQGVRPISVDKEAEMRNMEIIDRICLAVFGKTEYYDKNLSSYGIDKHNGVKQYEIKSGDFMPCSHIRANLFRY